MDWSAVQCRERWSNLSGDYEKVKEWERTAAVAQEPSFWAMSNDARQERRLPGFFDRVVYEILDGRGRAILKGRSARDATEEEGVVPVESDLVIDSGDLATDEALFLVEEEEKEEAPAPVPPPISDSSTHMEALDCASLGVVGSLLRKLNELLCIGDQARQLIRGIDSIRTMLEKLSDVHDPPHMLSFWMKAARELSYDMLDFVDQFVHTSSADAENDRVNQLISLFKTRVEELIEKYNRYSPEYVRSQTTDTLASYRVPVVHGRKPHPVVFVGIDCPANEILQWLKPKGDDDRDKQLKVVSILGVEGIGKSTLAHKLWRELEGDFECRAFIQTAKKPDIRTILTNILSQVCVEQSIESFIHVPNLIQDIRKNLKNKRYFVVIDDIWTLSVWDVLSRAFPDCNCLSRIMITTTTENIAVSCCSYDSEYIFKMKPLREDHSKTLFTSTAFGPGNRYPPQVNDIIDEITMKCGGLPLALICLAAVVARLPEIEQQLKYVKFVCSNLQSNSMAKEVLNQVLKLCCNSLPHSLKTCLMYLSVYPTSYTILKEDLVKQWIAEGFICALDGNDIEEVATSYFDELVNLNLIQQLDISNEDRKRVSYRMHPMVHCFIEHKSTRDNFVTVIDYTQSAVVFIDKIHRLALHFGSATYATTPESVGLSQVRSFAFMGLISCMPSLGEFELVRVIILHIQDDHGGPTFSLKEIGKLFLLRYLQVRCMVTIILPDQVQCLKHLETIEINAEVSAVPSDIVSHPTLKHVHLGRKMKHNHVVIGPDTLHGANFWNVSGIRISSASLRKLELLPCTSRICTFPWLPAWVQQLHGLRILEIVVKELRMYDMEYLSNLPFLTALSVYVRKHTARQTVTFRGGTFTVLKFLKLVSGVLLLTFQENAVCNLERLKISFNTRKEDNCEQILCGIHNLTKLHMIVASIGAAEESDRIFAESVLRDAISKHPCHPSFKVKRVEPIDEELESGQIDCLQPSPSALPRQQPLPCALPAAAPPLAVPPACQSQAEEMRELDANEMKRKKPESSESNDRFVDIEDNKRNTLAEITKLNDIDTLNKNLTNLYCTGAKVFATGAISTLLPKLAKLLYGEYKLQKGVRKSIEFIKKELEHTEAALHAVSEVPQEQLPELVKIWARDARELSYTMEDIVDTFLLRVGGPERPSRMTSRKFIKRLITMGKRHQMGELIKDIKERVVELAARRDRFKNHIIDPVVTTVDPRIVALYAKATNFVGINNAREDLVLMLKQQRIVSIVGLGGLGKTTLAKAVYDNIKSQFDHTAFVIVSHNPDMKKFLKDMLYELHREAHGDIHNRSLDEKQLIDIARVFLHNKRYLIIIDDIWNISHWDMVIKHALPDNNIGCRIITTTRNINVAEHIGLPYKMQPLSIESSRTLLYRRIYGTEDQEKFLDEELAEVSDQILKKCAGVPLAIITIGSLLASKPRNKWDDVYNSIGNGMENSLDVENMRKILLYSYYDLPSHLRTCLLYLSIFPEDFDIRKDRLIWMWRAEEFIHHEKQRRKSLFEVGESYFNELINRSMIQPIYLGDSTVLIGCRVHNMVLDILRSISVEENFITILRCTDEAYSSKTLRRLSVQNSKTGHALSQTTHSMWSVRSVVVFQSAFDQIPTLQRFKLLRVLDLQDCDLSQGYSLNYLGSLFYLRYLSLQNTRIHQLPESVANLELVEVLNLMLNDIYQLPKCVAQLTHLVCLSVDSGTRICSGIRGLTSLEELTWLHIDDDSADTIEGLGFLTELRVLRILLSTSKYNDKLVESLCKLRKIQSIFFHGQLNMDKLDAWILPQLRAWFTEGYDCWFSVLPTWMNNPMQLQDLGYLSIGIRDLRQEDLEILGRLPALRELCLKVDHVALRIVQRRFVIGAGWFPCLVKCALRGFVGPVIFHQHAMPSLKGLEFSLYMPKSGKIASSDGGLDCGLGNLPSLQEVFIYLFVQSGGASKEEVQETEGALRHAAEIHPNRLRFNISMGEYEDIYDDSDDGSYWTEDAGSLDFSLDSDSTADERWI